MKQRISITIDKDALEMLAEAVKDGKFRNRSHVIEYSLNKLLKERLNEVKE